MLINTNSDLGFLNGLVPGYGPIASQTLGLLHDAGHAADHAGLPTSVVDDSPAAAGSTQASFDLSVQNSDTVGAACLRLMGKKLLVALTMEGKFAGEGLQTIDEDDDMLSAMARELVEKNGIGDNADAIWRALHLEHQKLLPTGRQKDAAANNGNGEAHAEPANLIDAAINAEPILILGQSSDSLKAGRRRSRPAAPEQQSLFGCKCQGKYTVDRLDPS